jgi:hypothetical protein
MDSFVAWYEHQSDVQHADGIAGPPDPASEWPLIPEPYTKAQVLDYCDFCDRLVEVLDLDNEESGFDWYPIPSSNTSS